MFNCMIYMYPPNRILTFHVLLIFFSPLQYEYKYSANIRRFHGRNNGGKQ